MEVDPSPSKGNQTGPTTSDKSLNNLNIPKSGDIPFDRSPDINTQKQHHSPRAHQQTFTTPPPPPPPSPPPPPPPYHDHQNHQNLTPSNFRKRSRIPSPTFPHSPSKTLDLNSPPDSFIFHSKKKNQPHATPPLPYRPLQILLSDLTYLPSNFTPLKTSLLTKKLTLKLR